MKTYTVIELVTLNRFAVWCTYPTGNGEVVKTFKTRKGAENWVKTHSDPFA